MAAYTLGGRLILEVAGDHNGYQRYFSNEYDRMTTDLEVAEPLRITVRIVDKLPEAEPGDIQAEVRFKRLFTFAYLVRDIEERSVTIFFRRHWVDRVYMNAIGVFLQAQVLEPIMYMKLLEHGVVLLHAGGVADDSGGLLLPAHGGTGKTTLSIALLGQGFHLLGDDLLLVDVNAGVVHPYPRPLHIFTYNIRHLNGATIPLRYTLAVYAKNVIRWVLERALRTEFLISTRVHADEIFDGKVFGEAVPIRGIAFLRKDGPDVRHVAVDSSNVDAIADDISASADLNASLDELLVERRDLWREVVSREHEAITTLLTARGSLAYVNTRVLDLADLDTFADRVTGVA